MEKSNAVESGDSGHSSDMPDKTQSNAGSPIVGESFPLMDLERNVVGWESETDPLNPRNWSNWKKTYLMILMGIISTLSPLASSLVAPAIPLTLEELNETSLVLGSFMVTIYILGFAVGPLFLGPLSELYGRYPVVILSTWTFNAWVLGSALAPNMSGLIVMRFLAGVGGSGVMTLAPAIIADVYPVEQRAATTSLIVMAQSVGPALGPICGGFIAQELGWRWTYWVLLIASASVTVLMTFFMHESYAPRLLEKKAQRLRKETGRDDLRTALDQNLTSTQLLARSIIRPTQLLTMSPIVILICSYVSTIYGFMYLWFTTIPTVFQETYGWPTSYVGLAYTPMAVGMILSLFLIMKTNDATVIKLTKKNNNVYEPEMRLPASIYYAAFVPVSLFWYGWAVEKKAHWAVTVVGMLPLGFGMVGIFLPCQTYLVDAFGIYSASAVAASRTFMSFFGAFFPLAGPPLYEALGAGVGNTVLGLIALVMTPIPMLLYKYGGMIRRRYPVKL
ncbi:MFS general substrate transporter [Sodiomyces alkalinus F11]|uniref:MFS general substrate transporter n=1 Tax=Sodiomyces alkalinus (strain CBS 110278 / VKM F-3762 / F11) TaxID=1314773 RepID=A0A3N2Q4A9_SODAK|nr:MFS general substrate transporter [Sodiomyces alkalinus F11]ROT41488.1 MFS general substrate transporter [Sodiomyces alkalinus F11]